MSSNASHPPAIATTGVDELDRALNGLYWGDNVVFDAEVAEEVAPFYAAVAAQSARYEGSAFVTLAREPDALVAEYPGFDVIDARDGVRDFAIHCGKGRPPKKKKNGKGLTKPTGKPAGRAITDKFDPEPFNCAIVKHGTPVPGLNG